MNKPTSKPVVELILQLLNAPYAQTEMRHRCMLERDTSSCPCSSPRDTEVSIQHFTDYLTDLLVSVFSIPRTQLACFVFGPVRYSIPSMPNFDYLGYSGTPSAPRPSPKELLQKNSAVKNVCGTDNERIISSKRAELELPDSPFTPNAIDRQWDLHGSAYYTGADMSDFARTSVSPAHFVFGIECYGLLLSDYIIDAEDITALFVVINRNFRERVMMYATCCQGFTPTIDDASIN